MTSQSIFYRLVIVFAFLVSSCKSSLSPEAAVSSTTEPQPLPQLATPVSNSTATYIPNTHFIRLALWASPYLAATLGEFLDSTSKTLFVDDAAAANVKLEVGDQNRVSQWVYAVVTPFPSTLHGVSQEDLRLSWQGQSVGPLAGQSLLMDQNTFEMFNALWGPAAPSSVNIMAKNELLDYAWTHRPTWAIVPFEALEPRWKVLTVDGLSPLHKEFDPNLYPLTVPISLTGEPDVMALIKTEFPIPATNRNPQKLTVVAMTGVTALVRATAYLMEQNGITYPGQEIRNWLLGADITHISNEVPFAVDCPFPDPLQVEIRFCSRDTYIQLLEDVGTDVVELSGDHFQDWGTEAVIHTLAMYRERGWSYYGGGTDLTDGRKALLLENNGNKIAFIGCNAKGGSFAQASNSNPGAAACDLEWMAQEIQRLRQEGYQVIATFQHHEYYTYPAQPDQQVDFHKLAEAGAVIVSGSQAHQPQGMEFLNGAFLHYGLGNLFFDQYDLCPACRQGLVDRHVFYNGRYVSTEFLPIQFVDYARSRPMTPEEESSLLQALFSASGW